MAWYSRTDLSVDAQEMENAQASQASSSLARNQEAEGDFVGIANQSESLTPGQHFSHRQLSGRGESGRGWRDGIRRGLSWGYPFVGFDCGDVDTRLRDVSSRSACSGASGGGADSAEWRDERCCSAGRPFNSPFGGRVNADPAGALGSGSEFVRTREWDVVL